MDQNESAEFSSLTVDGEIVEGVEEFVYLGSKQTSDGYCPPEIMCYNATYWPCLCCHELAEKGVE